MGGEERALKMHFVLHSRTAIAMLSCISYSAVDLGDTQFIV